jgi:5-methylcytosine-specific restriction endonuclease McrA
MCRWCHKLLEGRQSSWCSPACEAEVQNRCNWDSARKIALERAKGICAKCGVDTNKVLAAFDYYERIWLSMGVLRGWAMPHEFRKACGFSVSMRSGHTLEINHKIAVAEGGSLCDQENLEGLCLPCHRPHTAQVVRRLAKEKRRVSKFHNGKV